MKQFRTEHPSANPGQDSLTPPLWFRAGLVDEVEGDSVSRRHHRPVIKGVTCATTNDAAVYAPSTTFRPLTHPTHAYSSFSRNRHIFSPEAPRRNNERSDAFVGDSLRFTAGIGVSSAPFISEPRRPPATNTTPNIDSSSGGRPGPTWTNNIAQRQAYRQEEKTAATHPTRSARGHLRGASDGEFPLLSDQLHTHVCNSHLEMLTEFFVTSGRQGRPVAPKPDAVGALECISDAPA